MFIYEQWDEFCRKLNESGLTSVTAKDILKSKNKDSFIILKHDVETNPLKALRLAQIENKYSHKGTYYVQAYLLNNKSNIKILKKIQELGHEVSYHHDVMDSNKGDINKAEIEFKENVELFEAHGFKIETVCQHGNPIIERVGYTSNRDFFRDPRITKEYHNIAEIMVNFKNKINKNYEYISDAGFNWNVIFDPENNDVIKSDDKNILLGNLDEVLNRIKMKENMIISTHPHRWEKNLIIARFKNIVFLYIKKSVNLMMRVELIKKIMSKFYFLAKII